VASQGVVLDDHELRLKAVLMAAPTPRILELPKERLSSKTDCVRVSSYEELRVSTTPLAWLTRG